MMQVLELDPIKESPHPEEFFDLSGSGPKSRSRTWILLFALLLVGIAGTGGAVGYFGGKRLVNDPYFRVSAMVVKGLDRIDKSAIQERLGGLFGQNIFLVDLEGAAHTLKQHPWIRRVWIRKKLPDTLEIRIEERKPFALIWSGGLYRIDGDGVILEKENENRLSEPVITGLTDPSVRIGQAIRREELSQTRSILPYFRDYRFLGKRPIAWIDLGARNGVELVTRDGKTRIRLGGEDPEKEYVHLQAVDRILSNKTDDVEWVDLTFPGKVIIRNVQYRG